VLTQTVYPETGNQRSFMAAEQPLIQNESSRNRDFFMTRFKRNEEKKSILVNKNQTEEEGEGEGEGEGEEEEEEKEGEEKEQNVPLRMNG